MSGPESVTGSPRCAPPSTASSSPRRGLDRDASGHAHAPPGENHTMVIIMPSGGQTGLGMASQVHDDPKGREGGEKKGEKEEGAAKDEPPPISFFQLFR